MCCATHARSGTCFTELILNIFLTGMRPTRPNWLAVRRGRLSSAQAELRPWPRVLSSVSRCRAGLVCSRSCSSAERLASSSAVQSGSRHWSCSVLLIVTALDSRQCFYLKYFSLIVVQ